MFGSPAVRNGMNAFYLADYGVQFVRIDPPAADSAFFKQLVAATDETSGTDKAIETPHIRGFFLTGNNEELSSAAAVWATEGTISAS